MKRLSSIIMLVLFVLVVGSGVAESYMIEYTIYDDRPSPNQQIELNSNGFHILDVWDLYSGNSWETNSTVIDSNGGVHVDYTTNLMPWDSYGGEFGFYFEIIPDSGSDIISQVEVDVSGIQYMDYSSESNPYSSTCCYGGSPSDVSEAPGFNFQYGAGYYSSDSTIGLFSNTRYFAEFEMSFYVESGRTDGGPRYFDTWEDYESFVNETGGSGGSYTRSTGFYDYSLSIRSKDTHRVPEPSTMLLVGTGLVGLVGSRLRKKK